MFINYNTFTQTVGSKMMVSAKDMPEAETISPMDLAEMMTAAANIDEEDMALAEEVLAPEAGEGEVPTVEMPVEDAEVPTEDAPVEDVEMPAEEAEEAQVPNSRSPLAACSR